MADPAFQVLYSILTGEEPEDDDPINQPAMSASAESFGIQSDIDGDENGDEEDGEDGEEEKHNDDADNNDDINKDEGGKPCTSKIKSTAYNRIARRCILCGKRIRYLAHHLARQHQVMNKGWRMRLLYQSRQIDPIRRSKEPKYKRKLKDCVFPGCHAKALTQLSKHMATVHKLKPATSASAESFGIQSGNDGDLDGDEDDGDDGVDDDDGVDGVDGEEGEEEEHNDDADNNDDNNDHRGDKPFTSKIKATRIARQCVICWKRVLYLPNHLSRKHQVKNKGWRMRLLYQSRRIDPIRHFKQPLYKRKPRDCVFPGCHAKALIRLDNHLAGAHKLKRGNPLYNRLLLASRIKRSKEELIIDKASETERDGMRQGVKKFWERYGNMSSHFHYSPSTDAKYIRNRITDVPIIIQCDNCLKWRSLPFSNSHVGLHSAYWECSIDSVASHKSCNFPEQKLNIPCEEVKEKSESNELRKQKLEAEIKKKQEKLRKMKKLDNPKRKGIIYSVEVTEYLRANLRAKVQQAKGQKTGAKTTMKDIVRSVYDEGKDVLGEFSMQSVYDKVRHSKLLEHSNDDDE